MTTERVKCTNCDHMVLPETASANNGLCMPCSMGDGYLSFKDLQKELDDLKDTVRADPSSLGIELPERSPYSNDDLKVERRPQADFSKANFVGVFRGELPGELFHPIGVRSDDVSTVEIEYIAEPSSPIDYDWIKSSLLCSPARLVEVVSKAFEQYMGDDWCGEDMKDEVIEELDDGLLYPKGESKCFIDHGYFPYFDIISIVIDRPSDRIIINGAVDIDYNLDEHGVSILIDSGRVVFGYGTEHG